MRRYFKPMNDVTVLITACGNPYMPGTAKCLKDNGERNIRLVGADMNEDITILQMFDMYYRVPRADDPAYLDSILDVCKKEKVDVLIPIMSAELELLSKNKKLFDEIGTKLSISEYGQLCIANNKLKLFEFMKENNIPSPKFYKVNCLDDVDKAIEHIGFPIVFKATEGSGSRGMRIIDPSKSRFDLLFHEKPNSCYITLKEFKEILSEGDMPEMLAMEYLPGNEYTVDMLVDNGEVRYSLCRKGLNVQTSIILDGVVVDKPEITALCNKIAEKLCLNGNIGFDVKERSDGTPVIMECNPRATAGVCEFKASGVNLLYLCVKQMLNEELPEITPEYGVVMKRRYIEMYSNGGTI